MTKQLIKVDITISKNNSQHIKVVKGVEYSLTIKNGDILTKDFPYIARKINNDLEIFLEKDKRVTFDDYFEVCLPDLKCIVTLPDEDNTFYIVDSTKVTTLDDGSEIVHFYGSDDDTLLGIANGQSTKFAESFADEYFSNFSPLGLLGLLGGGGGGSSNSESNNAKSLRGSKSNRITP